MSDNSPSVYERDGKVIYRASDIGGCITRLAAARQGQQETEPKEFVQMVFERGNNTEEKFFADHPDLAHYRQMEVTLDITKKISVVGHIDAHANNALIEVKRQADDAWRKWSWDSWTDDPLWVKYSWQISACMWALGWGKDPFDFQCHMWRVDGDTGEESAEEVKQPFWTKEDITARILEVETLAHEDKLVCTTPDFFCQYQYLHADDKEIVDDGELERLVDEYQRLQTLINGSRFVMDGDEKKGVIGVKDLIKKRLDELGHTKVLLMSGRSVNKSEYDTKEHLVAGSHQVRLTIK
jgi:hypothetical protein